LAVVLAVPVAFFAVERVDVVAFLAAVFAVPVAFLAPAFVEPAAFLAGERVDVEAFFAVPVPGLPFTALTTFLSAPTAAATAAIVFRTAFTGAVVTAITASAGPDFCPWFLAAIYVPRLLERARCCSCCH
jgi:hypothetical protein